MWHYGGYKQVTATVVKLARCFVYIMSLILEERSHIDENV